MGPYLSNWNEYSAAGAYVGTTVSPAFVPFTPEANPTPSDLTWIYNTANFIPMTAGHIYFPSFTWDDSSAGSNGVASIQGNVAMCYWAPLPVPGPGPGPMMFSAMAMAPPAPAPAPVVGLNEIVMGSKSDNTTSRLALHKKQVQGAKDLAARQASASSYPAGLTLNSAGGAQIGLNDLETIVRQIMRVQASQQPVQQQPSAPASPVIISSSSSASSSSSSSSNAAGKKRARDPAEYVGTQPPAKR